MVCRARIFLKNVFVYSCDHPCDQHGLNNERTVLADHEACITFTDTAEDIFFS